MTADDLLRIVITRVGLVPRGATEPPEPAVGAAALGELAHVGVRLTNPGLLTADVVRMTPDVVVLVRRLRGDTGSYAPLFPGFPDELPRSDNADVRFTIATVQLLGTYLTAGAITDADIRDAMDFSALGWWPASSVPQDVDRARIDRKLQELLPGDDRVEWLELTLADDVVAEQRLRGWMADAFGAPASLRADVREDLALLADELGPGDLSAADVPFIETRTLLTKLIWERDLAALPAAGLTPDDLLRLFADLTASDVSLATPITFPRFTRAQRRAVVAALEASPRLTDVFRRRGLWLAVARSLHLGERGARPAPRVGETFARLRAGRHDATSLPSRVERAARERQPADAVRLLADEAPGLLLRGLRRWAALSEAAGTADVLLAAVEEVGRGVPTRVLYAARAQVVDNGRTYPRVAFTKSGAPLKVDRPVGHLRLPDDLRGRLLNTVENAIDFRHAGKEPWAGRKVWIDPLLGGVLMPDALRTTAQGVAQLERGSRVPLGDAPVLRLFVHWREEAGKYRSDLDLSVQLLDADYALLRQVSWTNLGDGDMTHSGDLTSAPAGAQEFIDVRLDALRAERQARYVVPSVFRYAGPSFGGLVEAHVGWMLRQECSSDRRTFDPATVVNAFALTGSAGTAVPMLVDLATNEVVATDLYLRSELGSSVERGGLAVRDIVAAAANRAAVKVSVEEVAAMAVAARGAVGVDSRAAADLTFGLDDGCTYNALRPEALLAELY